MGKRIAALLATTLVLILGLPAPAAATGPKMIPVSAQTVDAVLLGIDKESYRGNASDYILQWWGLHSIERLEGSPYLQGVSWSSVDILAHYSCWGDYPLCEVVGGSVHATFQLQLDDMDGGWVGTANGVITGLSPTMEFVYVTTAQASGWGALEGWHMQLRVWIDPSDPTQIAKYYEGYLFPPGA